MKLLQVDTIEETKKKIDQYFKDIQAKSEEVSLIHADGRILGEDIYAPFDIPEFNRSTVDGYAVCSKDTFGVSESLPVFLDVIGNVEMGEEAKQSIKSGQAVYVPTGGMIPQGADAVIMIEHVENLDEQTIAVYHPVAPGENRIVQGEDFKKEQLMLEKGRRLGPQDIGALAAMGISKVSVFQRPKVAIISTGDEIVPPSEEIAIGQIRDINTYSLGALIEEFGGQITKRLLVKDCYNILKDRLESVLEDNDIILLSGGSSVGFKDMTAKVIDSLGEPGAFVHGVAVKPGKPTIIGKIKDTAVFGLPGHPVSAMIVCRIFVGHLIKNMLSMEKLKEVQREAICLENIHSAPGKETYQMVEIKEKGESIYVKPVYGKSGAISTLTRADGFIKIGTNQEGVNKGDKVIVTLL